MDDDIDSGIVGCGGDGGIDGVINDGCHNNNDDVHDGDIDEHDGGSRKMIMLNIVIR